MKVLRLPALVAAAALAVTGLVALVAPASATPVVVPPQSQSAWSSPMFNELHLGAGSAWTIMTPFVVSTSGALDTITIMADPNPLGVTLTDTDPRITTGNIVGVADLSTDVQGTLNTSTTHTYHFNAPGTVTAGTQYWLNVTMPDGSGIGMYTAPGNGFALISSQYFTNLPIWNDLGISGRLTVINDTDAPAVSTDYTPAAPDGTNGWYVTYPTVTFTCDDYTGVASCPTPQTATADGDFTPSGDATDVLGNSGTTIAPTVKVDTTAPAGVATFDGTQGTNGWYTSAGSATWTCSDVTSGIAACPADTPVTTDGTTDLPGIVTDNAGNTSAAPLTVKLDTTGPALIPTVSPAPVNGLRKGPITVSWTCDDVTSGVASCPVAQSVTGINNDTTVTAHATDAAGNTTEVTVSGLASDNTGPTVVGTVTDSSLHDWYSNDVHVTWSCLDTGSGVAACPATTVLTADGRNQVASVTVADMLGNTTDASVTGINIDKTAPKVTLHGVTQLGRYVLGSSKITCSVTDKLSGPQGCKVIYSEKPNAVGWYLVVAVGVDKAGNVTVSDAVAYSLVPKVTMTWPKGTVLRAGGSYVISLTTTDAKGHRLDVPAGYVLPVRTAKAGSVPTKTITVLPKLSPVWRDGVGRYHVRVTLGYRMSKAPAWKFQVLVYDTIYARAYQVR